MDENKRLREGGLNDPRLGTIDRAFKCQTCGEDMFECPGHFGHIELAKPVFHIGFISKIKKVCECVCMHCGKLLVDKKNIQMEMVCKIRDKNKRFQAIWQLSKTKMVCDADLPTEEELENNDGENPITNGGCGNFQPTVRKEGLKLWGTWKKDKNSDDGDAQPEKRLLTPSEILNVFKHISDEDAALLGFDIDYARPEWLILTVLPVPPPPVRPSIAFNETARGEDDLTYKLAEILKANINVQKLEMDGSPAHVITEFESLLQYHVATYMDNDIAGQPVALQKSGRPIKSIRARLKGKEGRVRGNLMGKRVDFSARTVISGDPNLDLDQVGVPRSIARTLTYPEIVTPYNIHRLTEYVRNGPNEHPGAKYVIRDTGDRIDLRYHKRAGDIQLQYGWKVERHLMDNDPVLFNRQPSLHKMSMMCHRVKVMPFSTFRINLSVTSPYNADFDGDEMNLHVPQSHETRSELSNLAAVPLQIISPQSNKPVMGIVQDTLCGVRKMTLRDIFLEYDQVMNICYWVKDWDGIVPQPTILKPKPLWTGKQILSLGIPKGINLIRFEEKTTFMSPLDDGMLVVNGEIMFGVVNKKTVGASAGGLIHTVFREKGHTVCAKLFSNLQKIVNYWLLHNGFSIGIGDTIADKPTMTRITSTINEAKQKVQEVILDAHANRLQPEPGMTLREAFEANVAQLLNKARDDVGKYSEKSLKDSNNVKQMVISGSKGSFINISQMSACVGQQMVEGKRIPFGFADRTLPHFTKDDFSPESKGFIENSYLRGLTPQEFFFHAMAGREGLIDTAVKTARSGYLQRCLIKQLEGIHVGYDNTVRDSDGTMIQFLYGGDSIDTVKESYLKKFEFCLENSEALKSRYDPASLADSLDIDEVARYSKKMKKFYKKLGKSKDLKHYEEPGKYDPIISKFNPSKYLGAVSSTFQDDLKKFIKENPSLFDKKRGISDSTFEALMHLKYMRSLVNPGEAVGIIAAESIGEPSTQMTLNTFHFAGHGAANVTLGIPRLREIVMTASASIQTPQMYLPVLSDITDEQAEVFCKSVAKIKFSELVDHVQVVETTSGTDTGSGRTYNINIKFFSRKEYDEEYNVEQNELELCTSTTFVASLEQAIRKELSNQKKKGQISSLEVGQAVPKSQQENAGISGRIPASGDNDDEDADDDRLNSNTKQAVSYDEPDDEELEIMRKAEKSDDDNDSDEEMDDAKSSADESSDDEADGEAANTSVNGVSSKYQSMTQDAIDRQSQVISACNYITKFNFDDTDGEWCSFTLRLPSDTQKLLMVDLVEETCRKVVVREIQNIGRCVFPKPENGVRTLTTEGVNFRAMFDEYEVIDVNGITSNDVAAVLKTYGVEAARNTIVSEIMKVFNTYSISVSHRHLDLIADYMTREGSYLAFNRQGIDSSTSAFKKMSYETTCQFLTKAVLDNAREELDSPSAKLVIGNLSNVGTGSFDVLSKMPLL